MDNKRKNYIHIDSATSSDEIFAILDSIHIDGEDEIDELMNDSDTEFIVEEEISSNLNGNDTENTNILTPDANVHVVKDGGTDDEENSRPKDDTIKWGKSENPNVRQECSLEGEICHQLRENVSPVEIFEKVVSLDILVELLVSESNLYAQQNGRNFITNSEEMKAFIRVNYIMAVNKLPNISMCWNYEHFIGNTGIQNVFMRTRFQEILQNIHFADNSKNDSSDKGYKIRPIIEHLNKSFQNSYSDEPEQSIDEHMTKFKGRFSMRQYLKMKPIKWWFRCASKNGYLYEFDLYLGRKQNVEVNLGEGVVLQLSEKLKGTFCTIYIDNYFNSPRLINKLFHRDIYAIGTVRSNRKQMPKLKEDKKMLRGDADFQFSKNIICCKWYDNKAVLLLATDVEGMSGSSNVMRRMKGSSTKTPVPCPNIIKIYNNGMGGVDLMDQKTAAYRFDRKSKFRFYLRIFFDLLDVALVNSHIVYSKLGNELSLLNYKVVVENSLIGRYSNWQRAFPMTRPSKRKTLEPSLPKEVPTHMPEFQEKRMQCFYCQIEGLDHKTFVSCQTCGLYLCCVKERNCFQKHHM